LEPCSSSMKYPFPSFHRQPQDYFPPPCMASSPSFCRLTPDSLVFLDGQSTFFFSICECASSAPFAEWRSVPPFFPRAVKLLSAPHCTLRCTAFFFFASSRHCGGLFAISCIFSGLIDAFNLCFAFSQPRRSSPPFLLSCVADLRQEFPLLIKNFFTFCCTPFRGRSCRVLLSRDMIFGRERD